jgi:hypothetical protein
MMVCVISPLSLIVDPDETICDSVGIACVCLNYSRYGNLTTYYGCENGKKYGIKPILNRILAIL